MQNRQALEIAINFLLVLSWALVFIGFFIGLYLFLSFGFLAGVCAAFLCTTPGLSLVLAMELFFIQKEKLKELKSQTTLLHEIRDSVAKS